jgi:hypothetical protein
MKVRHWLADILFILLMLASWQVSAVHGEERSAGLEDRVKAAFLYKFTGYIEWPPTAFAESDSPLVIGVLGDQAMVDELAYIVVDRLVNNRRLSVVRVMQDDALDDLHILFIRNGDVGALEPVIRRAHQHSVLVVTEMPGALQHGSVINFILVEQRVRFEISQDTAERSGLKLSSRLLAVAERVEGAAP